MFAPYVEPVMTGDRPGQAAIEIGAAAVPDTAGLMISAYVPFPM
jgi:hypothetical protein